MLAVSVATRAEWSFMDPPWGKSDSRKLNSRRCGVESLFGFVLTHSTVPDLHSHSWASALWRNYATGDNRRTYICILSILLFLLNSHVSYLHLSKVVQLSWSCQHLLRRKVHIWNKNEDYHLKSVPTRGLEIIRMDTLFGSKVATLILIRIRKNWDNLEKVVVFGVPALYHSKDLEVQ